MSKSKDKGMFGNGWGFSFEKFLPYFGQTGVVVMSGGVGYGIFLGDQKLGVVIALAIGLFLFYIASWGKKS